MACSGLGLAARSVLERAAPRAVRVARAVPNPSAAGPRELGPPPGRALSSASAASASPPALPKPAQAGFHESVLYRDLEAASGPASRIAMERELKYGCHNYQPLPVVLKSGRGVAVWDVEGREYLDCMAGYGAVNQGHSHPRLVQAMRAQLDNFALASRAFYNNVLGEYEEFMTGVFRYDKLLPTNTGVEGGETAVKLARRWAYDVKGVPENRAKILFAEGNFWGRTLAAVSSSSDPSAFSRFGPFAPGFELIPYNDLAVLEAKFRAEPDIAAFFVEALQGEGGVVVPDEGYLRGIRALCDEYNVLWIGDEVQTGCGRTGYMAATDHEGVQPDLLILAKSLSGGMYPVSCVLANDPVMMNIYPGEHGSTFGGNPLGCTVALEAVKVLLEEKLPENAAAMGEIFRDGLEQIRRAHPDQVVDARGRGLMNALELTPGAKTTGWDLCLRLRDKGLLAKPTHGSIVRFTPPLVIDADQVNRCIDIIGTAMDEVARL